MFKAVFVVYTLTQLSLPVLSQCLNRPLEGLGSSFGWSGPGLGANPLGFGCNGPASGFGPGLSAPIAPGLVGVGAGLVGAGVGLGNTYASPISITPTTGGGLFVSSASSVPPTGITVASENAYEGVLGVIGELPFVGSAAMDGIVPSNGAAAVNHACGNGITAAAATYAGSTAAVAPVSGFRGNAGPFLGGNGFGLGCGRGLVY